MEDGYVAVKVHEGHGHPHLQLLPLYEGSTSNIKKEKFPALQIFFLLYLFKSKIRLLNSLPHPHVILEASRGLAASIIIK